MGRHTNMERLAREQMVALALHLRTRCGGSAALRPCMFLCGAAGQPLELLTGQSRLHFHLNRPQWLGGSLQMWLSSSSCHLLLGRRCLCFYLRQFQRMEVSRAQVRPLEQHLSGQAPSTPQKETPARRGGKSSSQPGPARVVGQGWCGV
jgi:hypothetical protein